MSTISVEVIPCDQDGHSGPFRAGMAIVSLNGKIVARLRTTEGIEFTIHEPQVVSRKTHAS